MRSISSTLMLATTLAVAVATPNVEAQVTTTPKPAKSGHVQANGIDYYYEIHGSGEPLLLLHGGLGSIDMFGSSLLPALAKTRQVIAVDLQGHGRTTLGDRPINLIDIANDLGVVLDKLGLKQVDVVGYSFGGGAGLRLAVQHPNVVRRLTVISAPYAQNGFFPEMLPQQAAVGAAMAEQMKETPMYKSYVAVAPNPKDFPRLLDRMGEFMRRPYDWSEEVKRLSMPVMLVYGDADMVRPEHIVQFYQLLGGGLKDAGWQREHMSRNRLAILPDVTHYDMFLSPDLARTILPFLDGKSGSKSWADQVKEQ
jgi:pimeloyl-ACP methyl ester carboxylesterase